MSACGAGASSAQRGKRAMRGLVCPLGACLPVSCLLVSCLLLAGISTIFAVSPAQAQTKGDAQRKAVLILDGSGSMWGRLGASNKVSVARDALNAGLEPYSGRLDVGLVFYGHRRKGDCQDVERALEPLRLDAAQFERSLQKFSPRGKTPIATAIETAAEMLELADSRADTKADIVLLTDGAENCQRDPCATVRNLRAQSPGLKVHVLALAMKPEETAATRCIAREGGGEYIEANNQAELQAGILDLFSIIETGVSQQLAAERARQEAEANQTPGLQLAAVFASGGPAAISGVRWLVTKAGSDVNANPEATVFDGEGPVPRLDLAPGQYDVVARIGLVNITKTVEVAARGTTDLLIDLNSGSLRLAARSEANGPLLQDMFYSVFPSGSSSQRQVAGLPARPILVSREPEAIHQLPAGSYRVVAEHGLAQLQRSVEVVAGRENAAEFIIYAGEVTLQAVTGASSSSGSTRRALDDVVYTIYEDDPASEAGLRIVTRSAAPRPTFNLPAGLYHVHVRHGAIEARDRITVRPGEATEVELDMSAGTLQLASVLMGEKQPIAAGLAWRIERLGANGEVAELVLRTARTAPEVPLTVGRYRVTGHYGPVNASASAVVDIRPGRTQPLILVQEAGVVQFRLVASGAGGVGRDIYWELRGLNGVEIWATGQAAPELPLGEGVYEIIAISNGKRVAREFQIAAGERKLIEISTE